MAGAKFQPETRREEVPRIPTAVFLASTPVERAATVVAYLQRAAEAVAAGRTANGTRQLARLKAGRRWAEEATRMIRLMAPAR